jgi:ABC-type transport system substrate-binding protein
MTRRLALALVTLVAGAGLLAAAALGSSGSTSSILKIGSTGPLGSIDPAIAYGRDPWMFEAATGATLFRASAGVPVPEVAKRFTVSKNGRVYRFFLRKGYRFSDGEAVRAKSFAYAIKRSLSRGLNSPGGGFVMDLHGVYIVGSAAYSAGTANDVRGVKATGLTLTIRLAHADPNLLSVLALPFFQAASSKLSLTRETVTVRQVGDLPTAGPYTWSYNAPAERAAIVPNPYYAGTRGRHLDEVDLEMGLDLDTCFNETKANQLDIGCLPHDQVAGVAQEYGVSRTKPVGTGRFWVKPTSCESPLLFNQRRSLFSGNTALRQALNWAVDRAAIAGESSPYATTPLTHLLPPGFPGAITAQRLLPYSLHANLAKARQLASGHLGDGNITVAYQSAGRTWPAIAEQVRQALVSLGFEPSRIDMRAYGGFELYEAISGNPPIDLVVGVGYCSPPSPDPAALIGATLNMPGPFGPGNAAYSKAFYILSRKLKGKARVRALARFDVQVMKNLAPVAMLWASNDLTFFSDRVDPARLRYSPDYGWSLTALRLK